MVTAVGDVQHSCDFFDMVDKANCLSLHCNASRSIDKAELITLARKLALSQEHGDKVAYWIQHEVPDDDYKMNPFLLYALANRLARPPVLSQLGQALASAHEELLSQLGQALGLAQLCFVPLRSSKRPMLFIVSIGEANDPLAAAALCSAMQRQGILIASCFLTSGRDTEKTLFYKKQSHWSWGAQALFDYSSNGFRNVEAPVSLLVQQGFQVADEGQSTLFLQANSVDAVIQFQSLLLISLMKDPQATSLDVDWLTYLNIYNNAAEVHNQCGPTCWAHAVATVVHLTTNRVIGRSGGYPSFESIRENLFERMTEVAQTDARGSGNDVEKVLTEVQDVYRIHFKIVDEVGARKALNHHRQVIACFSLFESNPNEWKRMTQTAHDGKIADKSDIQAESTEPRGKLGRHAVVLVAAGPDYLEFQNSWGKTWGMQGHGIRCGQKGRFRIRDALVLRDMTFYDVFWYEADLTDQECQAWKTGADQQLQDISFNTSLGRQLLAKIWKM